MFRKNLLPSSTLMMVVTDISKKKNLLPSSTLMVGVTDVSEEPAAFLYLNGGSYQCFGRTCCLPLL
jgi:hypothetical protein